MILSDITSTVLLLLVTIPNGKSCSNMKFFSAFNCFILVEVIIL